MIAAIYTRKSTEQTGASNPTTPAAYPSKSFDTDAKPEQETRGSLKNVPALYVTAHRTGKRREGRIVIGMGVSQGGVL